MPAICQAALSDEARQQMVNAFLQNVIGLETKNYEMKLVSEMNTPERGAALLYNLNSDDGKLEIIINFRNDEIVSCSINQIKGSITIANPEKNTLSATQELLDNYQAYSNASYIQPLKENIQAISELKNTTITTQYAKLSISIQDSEYQCFDWMNAPNGIHNMYNRLSLVFQNVSLNHLPTPGINTHLETIRKYYQKNKPSPQLKRILPTTPMSLEMKQSATCSLTRKPTG
jgi:hypothetical protein